MNASVGPLEVDWRLPAGSGRRIVEDPLVMKLVGRLATTLLRPLSSVTKPGSLFPELSETAVRKLAANPNFGPPLQRRAARHLQFDALNLTPAFFSRLLERSTSRLCVLLVIEPFERICDAALDLGTVGLQRRIVSVVLKADRAKLRSGLGEDRLRLATQEAPMLYSGLADFCAAPHFDAALRSDDPSALADCVGNAGGSMLRRFVELFEPELAPILRRRRPDAGSLSISLADAQREQMMKLFRRRTPAWSDIIA